MKIIATVNELNVLCEVSKADLAKLTGYESVYDEAFKRNVCIVGTEIDLSGGFATLDKVRNFDKSHITQVINRLESATDQMKSIQNTISKLTIFDTLSEDVK